MTLPPLTKWADSMPASRHSAWLALYLLCRRERNSATTSSTIAITVIGSSREPICLAVLTTTAHRWALSCAKVSGSH